MKILGINNRNLKTFQVDLGTTEILAEEVPEDIILVTESGIFTAWDFTRSWNAFADFDGSRDSRSPVIPARRANETK